MAEEAVRRLRNGAKDVIVPCTPKIAAGVDEPIPTRPFPSTVKSELVAEPFALVEDAISKRGMVFALLVP